MLEHGQSAAAESPGQPRRRLGRYELIARIADGGMAEVHLARQLGPMNFQKVVVVKVIHPNLARQKEFIGMLLDEARISALIKHPRVVDIYDLGVSRGTYFIAMEYLAGQPLNLVITRGRRKTPLDVYSTARVVADAAEGLDAAHNLKTLAGRPLELVHRDVSPSNIIVLYDGRVKLVDFGVAKARGRITETQASQIKGKVGYVSPEQIMENPVDRRSDVFSLGVVLWESLALRRLFDAGSEAAKLKKILEGVPLPPSAHRPEVPYELDKICLKALSLKPEDRFQSAGEMNHALEELLGDANYRREAGAVARFMTDTFAAERQAEQSLLRTLAESDAAAAADGGGAARGKAGGARGPAAIFGDRVRMAVPDDPDIDTGVNTFVREPGELSRPDLEIKRVVDVGLEPPRSAPATGKGATAGPSTAAAGRAPVRGAPPVVPPGKGLPRPLGSGLGARGGTGKGGTASRVSTKATMVERAARGGGAADRAECGGRGRQGCGGARSDQRLRVGRHRGGGKAARQGPSDRAGRVRGGAAALGHRSHLAAAGAAARRHPSAPAGRRPGGPDRHRARRRR